MQFVRMVQFTRLVKINGRLREFNFRKLTSPEENLFTVNVCNDRGDRIIFGMRKSDNTWQVLGEKLPEWIVQSEAALGDTIDDELTNW